MKHWEILKKYIEIYETQQKVLEHALESLDKNRTPGAIKSDTKASRTMLEDSMAPVQKYAMVMLIESIDLDKIADYMVRVKPTVYALEYYYHKPITECSLKEVIDGLVTVSRVIGLFDSVECEDNGDHYTFKVTHSMGLNGSKVAQMANGILFDTYGISNDVVISDKGLVQTIYKKHRDKKS
jgi:hypothetical protein